MYFSTMLSGLFCGGSGTAGEVREEERSETNQPGVDLDHLLESAESPVATRLLRLDDLHTQKEI